MTVKPGWYPDPFARDRLRWWDGSWSSHVALPGAETAEAYGALTLGLTGFVMIWFPFIGVLLSIAGTALAIHAVGHSRDEYFPVVALCINAVTLSLAVAALAWSFWVGLYGIAVAPWPN
jgi:hypothetical protein